MRFLANYSKQFIMQEDCVLLSDQKLKILVSQFQSSGSEVIFSQILKRVEVPVHSIFNKYHLRGIYDRDDFLQIVAISLYKSLRNYKDIGSPFMSFVFRIARARILDIFDFSKRRLITVELPETLFTNETPLDWAIAHEEADLCSKRIEEALKEPCKFNKYKKQKKESQAE